MAVGMNVVAKRMTMFIDLQKKNNVHDRFNVVEAKWELRDIMSQIDDAKLVDKLIKFFFIVAETKTWDEFKWNYESYLEAWLNYVDDYQRRVTMQTETVKGRNES